MIKQLLAVMCLFTLLICGGNAANAQLTFTFTPDTRSGAPGDTVTFSGTLTNTGGSTLFLNGDTPSLIGLGLTLDDTLFALNAPAFLLAGDSTGPIDLFDVIIDPATAFGSYPGSFSIVGGASSAQDVLATGSFTVVVAPAAVNTPEPGALALLVGAGLSGVGFVARRRRVSRAAVG